MNKETVDILVHLLVAMVAGGLIGLERSYYGRPAGFRTHTLVCMASSLLMLVTIYQRDWFSGAMIETVRVDPTRMAQGIMTGIGFLGAGVIMKEGASIRGLTTAASIWITAAIGILAGVGFYSALVVVTILTLGHPDPVPFRGAAAADAHLCSYTHPFPPGAGHDRTSNPGADTGKRVRHLEPVLRAHPRQDVLRI